MVGTGVTAKRPGVSGYTKVDFFYSFLSLMSLVYSTFWPANSIFSIFSFFS